MMRTHVYKAYGLILASELCLPELPEGEGKPDVVIRLIRSPAPHPPTAGSTFFEASPQRLFIRLNDIAEYSVEDGREITIVPLGEYNEKGIRLFLLGSVFCALLQQRGVLVLHGSSMELNGHGVLFSGDSGIGKSTLAAAFYQKGCRVLSDDVCAIRIREDGIPLILPGFPGLKLWSDAVEKLGRNVGGFSPLQDETEKYRVQAELNYSDRPVRLEKLFILAAHDEPDIVISEIIGFHKLEAVIGNTYRYMFLKGQGVELLHFRQSAYVANHVSVYDVLRPKTVFLLGELVSAIEKVME